MRIESLVIIAILGTVSLVKTMSSASAPDCTMYKDKMFEFYEDHMDDIDMPFKHADNYQKNIKLRYLEIKLDYENCTNRN